MGLRKYINDLGFSKKYNYGSCGRKFENGDFAKSLELSVYSTGDMLYEKNLGFKLLGAISFLAFPVTCMVMYATIRDSKKNDFNFYDWFSNNPNLILNH